MKILLTGSRGMVGLNVLEHAAAQTYDILTPSRQELDLLDEKKVDHYLSEHTPDIIIHAAGVVGGIQANMSDPVRFLVDNSRIGLNLITSAQRNGIQRFLNLSSSCMYPRSGVNPLSEDLVLTGELEPTNEGYALSKILSTRLCEYISSQYLGFNYKTIIPCNLYGRFDHFDPKQSHMIAGVIRKIHEAKFGEKASVEIWGDGLARREFMYAGDLADFIFYAIPHFDNMPQNINVGLGKDFSINDYYAAISKVVGYTGDFINDLSKPVGMRQKLVDDTRLRDFGWAPQTPLESGLTKTYAYFLETAYE